MPAFRLQVTPWADSNVHRTIDIDASSTLDALYSAIQRAFEYDDDHAYAFFMNGHFWDLEFGIWSTPERGQRATRTTRLETLGLRPKKRFAYLFDFGDEHRFDVRVIDITSQDGPRAGNVTASVGKAPPQYPSFDGDGLEGEELDDSEASVGEDTEEIDEHAAHVPSPEYADLVRRLEPVVDAWQQAEELEADFDDDLDSDDWDDADGSDDSDDFDDPQGRPTEGEARTAQPSATPAEEFALAIELLERTQANPATIHVHIEHATESDTVGWLFALPERLAASERPDLAATLAEQLVRMQPLSGVQSSLPRYYALAGRADDSRSALARNLEDEPEDSEVLFEAGVAASELGDQALAEQCYREALRYAGSQEDLREEIVRELLPLLEEAGKDSSELIETERARLESRRAAFAREAALASPITPVVRSTPKVGRNDPCPCGSGKKYKKCCASPGSG
jgi:tetratricopeptide (TPR) repeat protein